MKTQNSTSSDFLYSFIWVTSILSNWRSDSLHNAGYVIVIRLVIVGQARPDLTAPWNTIGNREINNLFMEIQSQVRGQYYWSHSEGSTLPIINFHTRLYESMMPLLRHLLLRRDYSLLMPAWWLVRLAQYNLDEIVLGGWRTESLEETNTMCTSTAHTMIQYLDHWMTGFYDSWPSTAGVLCERLAARLQRWKGRSWELTLEAAVPGFRGSQSIWDYFKGVPKNIPDCAPTTEHDNNMTWMMIEVVMMNHRCNNFTFCGARQWSSSRKINIWIDRTLTDRCSWWM